MQTCHSCEKNTTHKSWYSHTLHNNELSTGTGISRPAAVTDTFLLANLLTLNSSKTEFLIIGIKQQLSKIDNSSLTTPLILYATLVFIFDEHLTFSDQISSLSPAILISESSAVSILTSILKQPVPSPPLMSNLNLTTVTLSTTIF